MKKKILITGGTGGIGLKIVTALLKEGHEVIIWARDLNKFKKLKKETYKDSKKLYFQKVDVGSLKSVKLAAKKIKKIDVLINMAAVLWPVDEFLKCNLVEMRKALDISMWGTIYTCYFIIPKLRNGKVINFSGGGGANARRNHMAYSLAKTALIRFTENLAEENPDIDINIIAPGAHKTSLWNDEKYDNEPEKWGDIDALVKFINFLLSKKSNNITGRFINYKDNWNEEAFISKLKKDSDLLTLRRIDDFNFTKCKKK